jgi:hypothetical protein
LSISATAQNLSLNLPFINENAEPELFFFDPNYDKDNNIDYYSFGDLIKMQYEYNEQRIPVRKTLYILDKHDREYEKMMVTEFKHENGKLIKEQTTQFYSGDSPIYILSKIISHNSTLNIDTIRTSIDWLDGRFEGS